MQAGRERGAHAPSQRQQDHAQRGGQCFKDCLGPRVSTRSVVAELETRNGPSPPHALKARAHTHCSKRGGTTSTRSASRPQWEWPVEDHFPLGVKEAERDASRPCEGRGALPLAAPPSHSGLNPEGLGCVFGQRGERNCSCFC